MESLDDIYCNQLNFETVRQGFHDLAHASVSVLAKAICHDIEDVIGLAGTKEWRDTDDPYMDAVCDTIVDYFENDIKKYIDIEYYTDVFKESMIRTIDLYSFALLSPSRHKCSIDEKFMKRLDLEIEILYDFGMEYVIFEKFVTDTLHIMKSVKKIFQGSSDDIIQGAKDLLIYNVCTYCITNNYLNNLLYGKGIINIIIY